MRSIVKDFWIILILCYGVIGLTLIRADERELSKALAMVNEGKTDEAIALLHQEIERNHQTSDARLLLGVAYMEKNEYALARETLEEVVAEAPASVPAHYTLAMLFEKEKNYPRAIAEWQKVLQLSHDKNLKDLAAKHLKHLEGTK